MYSMIFQLSDELHHHAAAVARDVIRRYVNVHPYSQITDAMGNSCERYVELWIADRLSEMMMFHYIGYPLTYDDIILNDLVCELREYDSYLYRHFNLLICPVTGMSASEKGFIVESIYEGQYLLTT